MHETASDPVGDRGRLGSATTGSWLVTRPAMLALLLAGATAVFATIDFLVFSKSGATGYSGAIGPALVVATVANLLCSLSVLVMHRWPWVVMLTALVTLGIGTFSQASSPVMYVLLAVGGAVVGAWARHAVLAVPVAGAAAVAATSQLPGYTVAAVVYESFLSVLIMALAIAIGLATKNQQRIMAQLWWQHHQLETLQQRETDAAVARERARIARELHDVVAHHVSALHIQAQAGQRVARQAGSPEAQTWGQVADVAREILLAMRRLVGLLRSEEDDASPGPTETSTARSRDPQPDLAGLPRLAENMRRAGLEVRLDVSGDYLGVPADVQLGAYRIIQESLTNVLRHASATRARVRIGIDGSHLLVDVSDDGRVDAQFLPGNGLLGMRERVASLGGTLDLDVEPGRGLRVHAVLPLASSLSVSS